MKVVAFGLMALGVVRMFNSNCGALALSIHMPSPNCAAVFTNQLADVAPAAHQGDSGPRLRGDVAQRARLFTNHVADVAQKQRAASMAKFITTFAKSVDNIDAEFRDVTAVKERN